MFNDDTVLKTKDVPTDFRAQSSEKRKVRKVSVGKNAVAVLEKAHLKSRQSLISLCHFFLSLIVWLVAFSFVANISDNEDEGPINQSINQTIEGRTWFVIFAHRVDFAFAAELLEQRDDTGHAVDGVQLVLHVGGVDKVKGLGDADLKELQRIKDVALQGGVADDQLVRWSTWVTRGKFLILINTLTHPRLDSERLVPRNAVIHMNIRMKTFIRMNMYK